MDATRTDATPAPPDDRPRRRLGAVALVAVALAVAPVDGAFDPVVADAPESPAVPEVPGVADDPVVPATPPTAAPVERPTRPARPEVSTHRYGPEVAQWIEEWRDGAPTGAYERVPGQVLDVHRPTIDLNGDAPDPVVVFVHGGAWRGDRGVGADRHHDLRAYAPVVLELRHHGWTVVSIDYRYSNRTDQQFGDQAADVGRAVAWVADHADLLGVDADRIVLAGHSAGGQLAVLAAVLGTVDVAGVVAFAPVTDVVAFASGPWGADAATAAFLGCAVGDATCIDRRGTVASPATWLDPGDPPILVVHGDGDGIVDHGIHAAAFADHAARVAPGVVELRTLVDVDHDMVAGPADRFTVDELGTWATSVTRYQ